jgi:hypothetical protein
MISQFVVAGKDSQGVHVMKNIDLNFSSYITSFE